MSKAGIRKRLFAAIVTGSMVLGLAGCSDGMNNQEQIVGKKDQESVTLTFFGNKADESNVHVIEKIMRDFMKENPNIVITYESMKGTEYYETLLKRMETGSGDDIFVVDHDSLLTLREKGQVADLSDLSTIDSYSDTEQQQFTTEDGIFWVPTTVSAFGLYCNMDLLKKYNQSVPTDLQEFRTVCDYFLDQGITPVIANNDISLKTLAIGASYYNEYQDQTADTMYGELNTGKMQLGDSLSDGLALVEELIEKGYVDAADAAQTEKTSGDLENFAKGENPFMLTGVWASNRLKSDFKAEFNYEVYPLPILDNGSMVVVNPDVRLSVNADSEHQKEAKKFVEYFTKSENLQAFCEDQCSISPLKDGKSSSVKEIQPVIECYQQNRVVVGSDFRLELPIWDYAKNAVQEQLNGTEVSAVVDELNQQADAYINKESSK